MGKDAPSLSGLARKLRLAPNHRVAIVNASPGYLAQLAPAPADLSVNNGYRPVAFVKIDEGLTALRFKRT
jgi:hypothetical protein